MSVRTEKINLVATPEELARMKRGAKEHGMTLSTFLRFASIRMADMILVDKRAKETESDAEAIHA